MIERVDFHCHILPRADHGSDSVEQSLEQLALLKTAGVSRAVATPHFYPERISVEDFLRRRADCAEELANAMPEDAPAVYLGAEVLFCPGMEEMAGLQRLCIEGTNVLLLEMPLKTLTDSAFEAFERFVSQRDDLRIVLAHIDRYDRDDVADLMDQPVFAQINAHELGSRSMRKWLSEYIGAERVVALATDLHGADKKRIKGYLKGLSCLDTESEERICHFSRLLLKNAKPLRKN